VGGNWSPSGPPIASEALSFPSGVPNQSMTNDLPAGFLAGPMTFFGSGYSLSGNPLTLTGDVTTDGWTCNADLKIGTSALSLPAGTYNGAIDVNGNALTLTGAPAVKGALNGSGAVTITGNPAGLYGGGFAGTISGPINLFGSLPNAEITSGDLVGVGTVGAVSIQAPPPSDPTLGRQIRASNGGSPGTIHTKSLNLAGTEYLDLQPSGIAGSIQVTGTVSITGSLIVNIAGGAPDPGRTFTIIDNDGTDPVNGMFLQHGSFTPLPEGATFTPSSGPYTFRITYRGGDGNDVVLTEVIGTDTALSQTASTTKFGEPFTLTATVTSSSTPAGSVAFSADGVGLGTVPLVNGVASLGTSAVGVGQHNIIATFLGTGAYGNSVSGSISHVVDRGQTATGITSNHSNTLYGQTVRFTVAMSALAPAAGQPSGSVTILAGGSPLGTVPVVNGTATFDAAAFHPGTKSITASYSGDSNFEASISSAIQQNVSKAQTAVDTKLKTPILIGELPLITIYVNVPGSALVSTGTVSVSDGGAILGTQTLAGGVATLNINPLTVGDHTLLVNYSGDADFEASSATAFQSVVAPSVAIHGTRVAEGNHGVTTVSLVVSLSASIGQPVRVSFSTLAGSATEGEDYEKASGVIEFAPGEITKSIELHIFGDTTAEEDETFSVLLSNPENATIETASAMIVIANDDSVPPRRRPSRH
jgi:hypothetical protein